MREKSYWCQNNIIVIEFVCNYDNQHLKTVKIVKIVEWSLCMNIIKARAFIEICMYYWIWIKNFVIITQFIYILFKKSKVFVWKNSQIQIIKIFKLILTIVSALKIINYTENASKVICTIDVNEKNWEDNLMQVEWEKKNNMSFIIKIRYDQMLKNVMTWKNKNVKIFWKCWRSIVNIFMKFILF